MAPLWRLPLELLQQLHWWWIHPWRRSARDRKRWPALTRTLTLRACWLNSYRPAEVTWWWTLGIRSWHELAQQTPDSLTPAVHAQRRRHWPEQCRPALQLLADKAALLAVTPERWRAPFLVLTAQDIPAWWWEALMADGVVLKPLRGHGGRGVIRCRWNGSALVQQALFRKLPAGTPPAADVEPPGPETLLGHWQRLCGSQEPVLAAPYLRHSDALPATDPSVVVRVITARSGPQAPVVVRDAWLEVPLGEGPVAFISLDGHSLPTLGEPLTAEQKGTFAAWTQKLNQEMPAPVQACLKAAVMMHGQLPPIDQVAWDWIPASPQPLLLEGNGGFGLLVPQLFDRLRADRADVEHNRT